MHSDVLAIYYLARNFHFFSRVDCHEGVLDRCIIIAPLFYARYDNNIQKNMFKWLFWNILITYFNCCLTLTWQPVDPFEENAVLRGNPLLNGSHHFIQFLANIPREKLRSTYSFIFYDLYRRTRTP